jgi:hypothetical protein
MSGKGWIRIIVTILALCALMLNGCGKKSDEKMAEEMAEKMLKQATGKETKVDIQGDNVRIEDKDSMTDISATAAWPPEMFADVPKFTAGKIERVIKGQDGGMQKFNIYFVDIKGDAIRQYADALKKKGWQADLIQLAGQGGILNAQKGNLAINFAFSTEKKEGTLVAYSTPQG